MSTHEEIRVAAERVEEFFTRRPAESSAEELCARLTDARKVVVAYLALVNNTPSEVAESAAGEIADFYDRPVVSETVCVIVEKYLSQAKASIQRHMPPVNERLLDLVNAVGTCHCEDVLVDGKLMNWFDARDQAFAIAEIRAALEARP